MEAGTQKAGIPLETCRAMALLTTAYALFHGWADIFFIGELIDLPNTPCNSHQVFILFRTVGFFCCFAMATRVSSLVDKRSAYLASAAAMTASTVLMIASIRMPSVASMLQFGGACLGGLGIGATSMLWFESITFLKPLAALICYLLSALVTPSLVAPLYTAGTEALILCGFIAPSIAILSLKLSGRFVSPLEASPKASVDKNLFARIVALLSLFGFALAFREPMIGNAMFASGSYTAVGSLAMACIVLLGMAIWGSRFRLSFVCRILLPFTAVVFLLMPTQFPLMDLISDTCGSACDELVKILSVAVFVHQCWRNGASALRLFGFAYGVHGVLVFFGGQACLALMAQGVSDADLSAWFSIIAALVIAATIFILPNDYDLAPISLYDGNAVSSSKAQGEISQEDAARSLAARFGLTARETEILELMLEGKSIDDIASELVIARETVKTHRRNLFLKCEVHREEELRDLAKGDPRV